MLQFYIEDTQSLLRDSAGLFTPVKQLTRWINNARRQAAYRTGCLRALVPGQAPFGSASQPGSFIPGAATPGMLPSAQPLGGQFVTNTFTTITGVEKYDYKYGNAYLSAGYTGYGGICDVIDVAVSWGGVRPNMAWIPWDDLQAYARSYNIGVYSYPFYWSTYNDGQNGQVWLFPVPSTNAEMEWDCFCFPTDIYTDSDYDAIPGGFRDSIKYYAASLAFLGAQRPGQAAIFENKFNESLGIGRHQAETGKTSDYYWTNDLP